MKPKGDAAGAKSRLNRRVSRGQCPSPPQLSERRRGQISCLPYPLLPCVPPEKGDGRKKWVILWFQIARARVGHLFRFAPQAEGGRERQTSKLSFSISRLSLGPTIGSIPHPNPQRCLAHPTSGMRGAASLLPAKGVSSPVLYACPQRPIGESSTLRGSPAGCPQM